MKQDNIVAVSFEGETIKIANDRHDLLFDDLAYICFNQKTQEVLSIGAEAKKILTKIDQPLVVSNPVADSEIIDEPTFFLLLNQICQPLANHFKDADLVVSVSDEATEAQNTLLRDFFNAFGPHEVMFVSETYLAALGSGCLMSDHYPTMFLNIGYQSTTIAIIQANEIIRLVKLDQGEKNLNQEIDDYFARHHHLEISQEDEKNIYFSIASVAKQKFSVELILLGRDLRDYNLKKVVVNDAEVRNIFINFFGDYRHEIIALLADSPTSVRTGIAKNGLVVSGTLARIYGIESFFTNYFDFPTKISKYPNQAAFQGALKYEKKNN